MNEEVLYPNIEYTGAIVRFYTDPDGYEEFKPFEAVCYLQFSGDNAHIAGMHGNISRKALRALAVQLIQRGIRTVSFTRHHKGKTVNLFHEVEKYL